MDIHGFRFQVPSSAYALSDLPRGVLLHTDKEMHELNKLLIKKHLFSALQTQCLSPQGQMSYSQISPKPGEMDDSFTYLWSATRVSVAN